MRTNKQHCASTHVTRRDSHPAWAALGIALIVVLLTPTLGLSWGRVVHRITARMAETRLTPVALAAVQDLLGPGVTLADVAGWADDGQREIPNTATWHYVDVPLTAPRYDPKYCPPKGCVVGKIMEFKKLLLDSKAGKLERQQALKFLIHFLQDLHCPPTRRGHRQQGRQLDPGAFLRCRNQSP